MPFDNSRDERNLFVKLKKYIEQGRPIVEAPNSITIIQDFLQAARQLIDGRYIGIFNVVNSGAITHKEILSMYGDLSGNALSCRYITPAQLDSLTKSPRSNCVLSNEKLLREGISMPEVHESVRSCLEQYIMEERRA